MSNEVKIQKQPKVLRLAALAVVTERFGYYITGFLLTLYVKAIYKFTDAHAFEFFALFTALGYLTPAIGGYLADNFIGIKRCLGLGLIIEGLGYFLLAIPNQNVFAFYSALGAVVIGAGIFKTAPGNLLGRAYEKEDPRIDSGFTLYYMWINIGSFSAGLVAGPALDLFGWHVPFLVAGIVLIIGFIWFLFFKHYGNEHESNPGLKYFNLTKWFLLIICILIGIALCAFLMSNLHLANLIFYVISLIVIFYFVYQIIISSKEDRVKIIVCLILIGMAAAFFILYYQLYESIILFIKRCVDRNLFGILNIPTVTFPGLNGFAVIILSPLLAMLYNKLERHKRDLAITTKFPLGILLIASGFFMLSATTLFAHQVSCFWVILFMFIYSLGELLISALGFAMITRIVPQRLYGVMMGTWYLIGTATAADLSGNLATLAQVPKYFQTNLQACLKIYGSAFFKMGLLGLSVAIIGFIVAPWLKKAAKI